MKSYIFIYRVFQLHHTGIKTLHRFRLPACRSRFQLHHTGIKTGLYPVEYGPVVVFQLHHTGIKTHFRRKEGRNGGNFNCTIQELKLDKRPATFSAITHFNCTIQELKLKIKKDSDLRLWIFQLHHTGIKTMTTCVVRLHALHFNCTIQELKHPGSSAKRNS